VEKFIDTPLKHYSSGMQLRLAFSVAAHLEPEILLIDEVLAVGDMEFQKKCIGKMEEVSKQDGRTILFVSHNMGAIQSLCNKTLYLSNGKLLGSGNTSAIIEEYLKAVPISRQQNRGYGNKNAEIISCNLILKNRIVTECFLGHPVSIQTIFIANENLQNMEIAFNIKNVFGEIVTHSTTLDNQIEIRAIKSQKITVNAALYSMNMTPGTYSLDIFLLDKGEIAHALVDYFDFSVLNSDKALRPNGFPPHVKTFTETNWEIDYHESV